MRLWTVCLVASVSCVLGVGGCPGTEDDSSPDEPGITEQVGRQTGRAMDTVSEFAAETKDEFVAAAQTQLDQLRQKYEQWKEQHPQETQQAQERMRQLQTTVEKQLDAASESLSKAREAGEGAWRQTASAVSDALAGAQKAYEQLVSNITEEPNEPTGAGQ